MNNPDLLHAQKMHLAGLLEAIQRCVYFFDASDSAIEWPLTGEYLSARKKITTFLKPLRPQVLAIFEKNGVVLSIADWQVARAARNLAAHDYEIDYNEVAQHFNALHALKPSLYQTANRFVQYASQDLAIAPASADFASEFAVITKTTP